MSIILSTIVLRGNRHLKELPKKFWDNIMEKKNFYCQFWQIISQPSKLAKNVIKKWLNSAVKKNNYPQKIHSMKCRNFYIEVVMTIKYENKSFFSKILSQIDVFSCANLEYTTKNDRPVRSQKIWKIYTTFVLKWPNSCR